MSIQNSPFVKRISKAFNKNKIKGKNNICNVAKNIFSKIKINGNNNEIYIEQGSNFGKDFNFKIKIFGNNNKIIIKKPYNVKKLSILIGMQLPINNSYIFIDELTSMVDVTMVVYQHNSKVLIGKNCMFSYGIQIRTGELPHYIFDKDTKEYLDKASTINIGNHVWIGERSTILKNASVADNSVVGCCSVVTKTFYENNVVLAGSPASIRRKNIDWVRNDIELDNLPDYKNAFKKYMNSLLEKNKNV